MIYWLVQEASEIQRQEFFSVLDTILLANPEVTASLPQRAISSIGLRFQQKKSNNEQNRSKVMPFSEDWRWISVLLHCLTMTPWSAQNSGFKGQRRAKKKRDPCCLTCCWLCITFEYYFLGHFQFTSRSNKSNIRQMFLFHHPAFYSHAQVYD